MNIAPSTPSVRRTPTLRACGAGSNLPPLKRRPGTPTLRACGAGSALPPVCQRVGRRPPVTFPLGPA